jgi:hypothetical protein
MKQLLMGDTFLTLMTFVMLASGLAYEIISGRRKAQAAAVEDNALAERFRQMRARLWEGSEVCAGLEAGVGVLLARAERAGRAALVSERQALAAVKELERGPDPRESAVLSVADHAILAEERMRRLLSLLKRSLPNADTAADLGAAQEAFRVYRDQHVRMCREGRDNAGDTMQVRHLVSEAVTLARIADLEDLAAVTGITL